jgi:hypothetical protein
LGWRGCWARWKSKDHGLAIGGQQHIGGLEVEVYQAAFVGILEGVRQAGRHPGQRVDISRPGQELPGGSLDRQAPWDLDPGLIKGVPQVETRALLRRCVLQRRQQLGERGPSQIRQAQEP